MKPEYKSDYDYYPPLYRSWRIGYNFWLFVNLSLVEKSRPKIYNKKEVEKWAKLRAKSKSKKKIQN